MDSTSRTLSFNLDKTKPKIAALSQLEGLEKDTTTMEDWNLFGLKSISSLSTGERVDEGKADRTDDFYRAPTRIPFFDTNAVSGKGCPDSSSCDSPLDQRVNAIQSLQPTPEKDNPCDLLTDLSFFQFE